MEEIFLPDDESVILRKKGKELKEEIKVIEGKILFAKGCNFKSKVEEYERSLQTLTKEYEELKSRYKELRE